MKRKIQNQTEEEEGPDGHAHEYLLAILFRVINVHRWSKSSLEREINLEVSKQMSNHHPKWEIPTQNEKIFKNHIVSDKFRNVDSNAFQKAIHQKKSTSPGVTIFFKFGREIIEHNLSKHLSHKSIILHSSFFIKAGLSSM